MILLAIEVVLIFTFTSSDNFTRLFYNLISIVQTYDPVYKNDPPEHIFDYDGGNGDYWYWISTPNDTDNSTAIIFYPGRFHANTQADRTDGYRQRPVLYLIQSINKCLFISY